MHSTTYILGAFIAIQMAQAHSLPAGSLMGGSMHGSPMSNNLNWNNGAIQNWFRQQQFSSPGAGLATTGGNTDLLTAILGMLTLKSSGGEDKISEEELHQWKAWQQMQDAKKLAEFITVYQKVEDSHSVFKAMVEDLCKVVYSRVDWVKKHNGTLYNVTADETNASSVEEMKDATEEEKLKNFNMKADADDRYLPEVLLRIAEEICSAGRVFVKAEMAMEAMKEKQMGKM